MKKRRIFSSSCVLRIVLSKITIFVNLFLFSFVIRSGLRSGGLENQEFLTSDRVSSEF